MDLYRRNQIREIDGALQNQSKINNSKLEYVNQTNFGAMFNLKIGAQMVGKLLKIVGLAQSSIGATTPYESSVPRYAQVYVNQDIGVPVYKWNYNQCVVIIDKWLKKEGYYEEFYSFEDKTKRNQLINLMYDKYVA